MSVGVKWESGGSQVGVFEATPIDTESLFGYPCKRAGSRGCDGEAELNHLNLRVLELKK